MSMGFIPVELSSPPVLHRTANIIHFHNTAPAKSDLPTHASQITDNQGSANTDLGNLYVFADLAHDTNHKLTDTLATM
jgi:hypothetical protein